MSVTRPEDPTLSARIPFIPPPHAPVRRVVLRRPRPDDLVEVCRWDADPDLVEAFGAPPSHLARGDMRHLQAIEVGGRFVGLVGLSGVSRAARSAELRVVIGRPGDRGHGLGREAVRAYLERVRALFDLDLVYVKVLLSNRRAIRCFRSCGFRPAGILRVRHDRRYADPPLPDDVLLMAFTLHQVCEDPSARCGRRRSLRAHHGRGCRPAAG